MLSAFAGLALTSACSRISADFHPPGDDPPPPPPLASDHATVGLVAAAASADALRADWRVHSGGALEVELALFVSTSQTNLFASTPIALASNEDHRVVTGLSTDDDWYIGLGARERASDPYVRSGPVLQVRTQRVLYVDRNAAPGGDGLSPATAFDDLTLAILQAFVDNGSNVWVRQGALDGVSVPLFTAVHAYGGFDATFDLAAREPLANPTLLRGIAGQPVVTTENGPGGIAILDGFEIDGLDVATDGLSQSNEDAQLRSLDIHDCQRGLRLRTLDTGPLTTILATNVAARANALEGISVQGVFDLTLEGCVLDLNGNEGLDLNHLVALDGGSASLHVRGTRFDRNGTEGLDCHLGTPLAGGATGGVFDLQIEDCDAQGNALDGLRIDVDYDFLPQWSTFAVVRGVRARANGGAGLHLDLDSRASAFVHRLDASANRGDGLLLTSETFPGMSTLSASALHANAGFGAQVSLGHHALSMSHCIVAGNLAGGVSSSVVGSIAHSSIFDQSVNALSGCVEIDDVDFASGDPAIFVRAPIEHRRIVAVGVDTLTLDQAPVSPGGSVAETSDDDVARLYVPGIGASVGLDPFPGPLAVPGVLSFFAAGGDAHEDWRLAPGSIAEDAGLSAPSAPSVDAGVFGAALPGVPGREDPLPPSFFHVASTTPAWSDGLTAGQVLHIEFVGGVPDPSTVNASVFAFSSTGAARATTPAVVAGEIQVPPPAGGWASGDVVVVFRGLQSVDGLPLGATVALRVRP